MPTGLEGFWRLSVHIPDARHDRPEDDRGRDEPDSEPRERDLRLIPAQSPDAITITVEFVRPAGYAVVALADDAEARCLLNRSQYLADPSVREFLEWVSPRLSQDGTFVHQYAPARGAPWGCRSLFDAYQRYEWPFSVTFPGEAVTKGRTLDENTVVLERLAKLLRSSLAVADDEAFYEGAVTTLRWGGVFPRNGTRLLQLGDQIVGEFAAASSQLEPTRADTERIDDVHLMNAGFTKIYSLLLDDFPIYDGRVGAALGYLVRMYCEEGALATPPGALRFAWGVAKGSAPGTAKKNRNPSSGTIRFPALRADVRLHTWAT